MAYGGDQDRRAFALTVNWVFTCISLSVVTLRLVSRRLLEHTRLEIDDGMIVLAMLIILTRTIWLSVNVSMGFGQHLLVLLKEDPVTTAKLSVSSYGLTAFSLWTFVFPKVPVVALIVRLFTTTDKRFGRILWSTLALLFIWITIMTIVTFVKCDPVSKNWAPRTPGRCWNSNIYLSMGYVAGGMLREEVIRSNLSASYFDCSSVGHPRLPLCSLSHVQSVATPNGQITKNTCCPII
jgi:hypothetical protein